MKIKRHKKARSWKGGIGAGVFIAVCVSVVIAILFALFGNSLGDIVSDRNYWLSVGVANGLLLVAFLLMYRIDAQNVALHENDLEDTEWLTTKRLKKLKEFTVTTWEKMPEHGDEIVIGAEKKGKELEIVSTSALHAMIVGTTGSGKTTGFVDQNIAILGRSKGKPSLIIADPKKELYEKHARRIVRTTALPFSFVLAAEQGNKVGRSLRLGMITRRKSSARPVQRAGIACTPAAAAEKAIPIISPLRLDMII